MSEHSDIPTSLRQQVFKELNKNPLLIPKQICTILSLPNTKNQRQVIQQYKKQWRREYENQQGLIRCVPDGVHDCFFKGKLVLEFNVMPNVWLKSKSKAKFWLFRNGLGRIRFFESTGTVELFVKKPSSLGKAMQLFCDGFVKTNLICDPRSIDLFRKTLMRRFHATFDTGKRQDYLRITAFKPTHKFEFVSGDKTHPTCFEFMFEYQAEVEQARQLIERIGETFELLGTNGKIDKLNHREFGVV